MSKLFSLAKPPFVKWSDIEALFIALGADIEEREGSRVGVVLFGEVQVYHRPHPQKETDKDAVISIKKWLERNGVKA
ncbi:hexulose-6-phosphate isomerase [Shewanella hafniensis]|uniref:type II toxin-antitoxin system HicA family toxin n=1 Tax=Shewanella hafniensis TaxID=365590 RepID=UPI001BC19C28|nr:type II toxin-antitoxin system HicA family toxin [Shewanella hafniensis]MCL1136459.1 type II toxin-antitoxin system HicA family toxin [Shewanella hafniensis]GIU34123.1 hexulose-6-phosphate isomerase [Shewanella hafniensis]